MHPISLNRNGTAVPGCACGGMMLECELCRLALPVSVLLDLFLKIIEDEKIVIGAVTDANKQKNMKTTQPRVCSN